MGALRIGRAPDYLASHACVPGSNPADPYCFFSEKSYFSLLNVTRRSSYWWPRRVEVETSVLMLISGRTQRCAICLIMFIGSYAHTIWQCCDAGPVRLFTLYSFIHSLKTTLVQRFVLAGYPSRHKTLNRCFFNVGPPSTTLVQR